MQLTHRLPSLLALTATLLNFSGCVLDSINNGYPSIYGSENPSTVQVHWRAKLQMTTDCRGSVAALPKDTSIRLEGGLIHYSNPDESLTLNLISTAPLTTRPLPLESFAQVGDDGVIEVQFDLTNTKSLRDLREVSQMTWMASATLLDLSSDPYGIFFGGDIGTTVTYQESEGTGTFSIINDEPVVVILAPGALDCAAQNQPH